MRYFMRDRFMFGILVGIVLLVILALVLFFIRQQGQDFLDESTPEGVVSNYVLALQRSDYDRAYSYLADTPSRPDRMVYRSIFAGYQETEIARTAVEISEVVLYPDGTSAMVYVNLVRGQGGLFGSSYRESGTVWLVKDSGAWRITEFPYPFWAYNTQWR